MKLSKTAVFIPLLLFLLLLPYLWISFFTNPIADDFSFVYKANASFFEAFKKEYFEWCGRYFSNLLLLINPIGFGNHLLYKLVPVILILLSSISFYSFIYSLTYSILKPIRILVLSLIISLLFLHQMPIISEGIYWYTGAITYQLGNVFFLFYVSGLILFLNKKYLLKNKLIHIFSLLVLLIACIGSNEIIMIAALVFSFVMTYFIFKYFKELKTIYTSLFITAILASLLVYLAPGNTVRGSFFSNKHQLLHSIGYASAQVVRFFFTWCFSVPLLALSVLYYPLNREFSEKLSLFKKSFYLKWYQSVALLLLIIYIGTFPPYWATGILGQHRTLNSAYFFFIILWFINLTVIYNQAWFRLKLEAKFMKQGLYFLLVLGFIASKNGYHVLNDLYTGNAQEFDRQMNERYTIIEQSEVDSVFLTPISSKPKSLFVMDITENPEHWVNKGYNYYFSKPNSKILLKKGY